MRILMAKLFHVRNRVVPINSLNRMLRVFVRTPVKIILILCLWCSFISVSFSTTYYFKIYNASENDYFTEDGDSVCAGAMEFFKARPSKPNAPLDCNHESNFYDNVGSDGSLNLCSVWADKYCTPERYSPFTKALQTQDCEPPKVPNFTFSGCIEPTINYFLAKIDFNLDFYLNEGNQCGVNTRNPINIASGNKYRSEADLTPSGSSPITFIRSYNSSSNKFSQLGSGWRHNYSASSYPLYEFQPVSASVTYVEGSPTNSSLYLDKKAACESGWDQIKGQYRSTILQTASARFEGESCNLYSLDNVFLVSIKIQIKITGDGGGGDIGIPPPLTGYMLIRADGSRLKFNVSGAGQYTAVSDVNATLQDITNGIRYTDANGTVEDYDDFGRLLSITSRTGITQTLSYGTKGLSTVTDSFGNTLGFNYDPTTSKLTGITLPNQSTITYTQDANSNLETVTREDTTTRTYHYEDTRFANALTGISNGNNERHMTFSYDAQGRAITSELAGGAERVTINFVDENTSTVTDALEQARTYRFTTINGVKKLTDIEGAACTSCGGGATHITYDTNGYVNSSTDFNNIVTSYINNTRGLTTTRTEAVGTADERITHYEWHASYALPTCIIEKARTTSLTYLANGQLETRTSIDTSDVTQFATELSKTCDAILALTPEEFAALNTRTTSYDYYPDFGLLKSVDGARTDVNDLTELTYDIKGNLSSITNALSHVTQLTNYTLRGQPQTLTDANDVVTTITYDARGRLDTVTTNTEVTDYDYDGAGNLDKVTLPNGAFIDVDYDAAHRLTDIRDQLGNHIHYTLNFLGSKTNTEVKDPAGILKRTSTQVFNIKNELEQTLGAANQTTDFLLYDDNGKLKTVRDPGGNITNYDYDDLSRLTTTTRDLDVSAETTTVSSQTYDEQNNLKTVTDPRGLVTRYSYDGLGNRTQLNSPDTGITNYSNHDARGNVLSMTDARNKTTTYAYDSLNRIDLITYQDGSSSDYVYDIGLNAKGRLSSLTYSNATSTQTITTSWTYDSHGRIKSRAELNDGVTLTSFYNYAANGNLETHTTPGGHTLVYTYTQGQISRVSVDNRIVMDNISYDPFGPPKSWTWGNGASVTRNYDLDGQLDTYSLGSTTQDNNYYPTGNVQHINDLNDASNNQSFNYDALHRLTNAQSASTGTEVFDYDASGNRKLHTVGTTNYDYVISASSNQLDTVPGPEAKNYAHDFAGNITSDGQHSYDYDDRGRLTGLDNNAINYAINGMGQRVRKIGSQALQHGDANGDGFVDMRDANATLEVIFGLTSAGALHDCNSDSTVNIQDIICLNNLMQAGTTALPLSAQLRFAYNEQGQHIGDYDEQGNAIQEVIWFAGQPVAVIQGDELYYVYADHLGTPRAITNQSNTLVWQWQSDAFGTTTPNEDVDGDGASFTFNLRFAGQYYDGETGTHYNYFRDYDPSTGRYVQSDPIGLGGGLNTYGYVGGNPLYWTDPYGLNPAYWVAGTCAVLAAGKAINSWFDPLGINDLKEYLDQYSEMIDHVESTCPLENRTQEQQDVLTDLKEKQLKIVQEMAGRQNSVVGSLATKGACSAALALVLRRTAWK